MKTKLTLLNAMFAVALLSVGCTTVDLGKGVLWRNSNHSIKVDATTKYTNSLLPTYKLPRTISFWVKPSKLPDSEAKLFWGNGMGIGYTNGEKVKMYWWSNSWQGDIYASAPLGQWTHVVSTTYVDDTIKVSGFVNGEKLKLVDSGVNQVGGGFDGPVYLGWDGKGLSFDGELTNIRLYNRALSADEVKALYELENPKNEKP